MLRSAPRHRRGALLVRGRRDIADDRSRICEAALHAASRPGHENQAAATAVVASASEANSFLLRRHSGARVQRANPESILLQVVLTNGFRTAAPRLPE